MPAIGATVQSSAIFPLAREGFVVRTVIIGPEEINLGYVQITLLPYAKVTGQLTNKGAPCVGIAIGPRILPVEDYSASFLRYLLTFMADLNAI